MGRKHKRGTRSAASTAKRLMRLEKRQQQDVSIDMTSKTQEIIWPNRHDKNVNAVATVAAAAPAALSVSAQGGGGGKRVDAAASAALIHSGRGGRGGHGMAAAAPAALSVSAQGGGGGKRVDAAGSRRGMRMQSAGIAAAKLDLPNTVVMRGAGSLCLRGGSVVGNSVVARANCSRAAGDHAAGCAVSANTSGLRNIPKSETLPAEQVILTKNKPIDIISGTWQLMQRYEGSRPGSVIVARAQMRVKIEGMGGGYATYPIICKGSCRKSDRAVEWELAVYRLLEIAGAGKFTGRVLGRFDAGGFYGFAMFPYKDTVSAVVRSRAGGARARAKAIRHIVLCCLQAMGALHESGIVHLDLKPSNIVVGKRAADEIRIIDFGLAAMIGGTQGRIQRSMRAYAADRLVTNGTGTCGYRLADYDAEVVKGGLLLGDDALLRHDIFAAGVIVLHCLTGGCVGADKALLADLRANFTRARHIGLCTYVMTEALTSHCSPAPGSGLQQGRERFAGNTALLAQVDDMFFPSPSAAARELRGTLTGVWERLSKQNMVWSQ